jgi:hypothetical protein
MCATRYMFIYIAWYLLLEPAAVAKRKGIYSRKSMYKKEGLIQKDNTSIVSFFLKSIFEHAI